MTEEFAERRTVDGRLIERVARPELAVRLGLEPHPEGGWYRRTWAAAQQVAVDGRTRPLATSIVFLLPAGEASAWHLVTSDELWIWSGVGSVQLQLGGTGDAPVPGEVHVVGDARDGHLTQALVPGGVWQRTLPADHDALVSCIVSPGFDFADFTLE
ncbi:MAG: cupin domain-containing protein [Microbacterium sp.]